MGRTTKRGEVKPPALLDESHDCGSFDSGNAALNDWLKLRALKAQGKTARTYVVCEGNRVVGYYCILSGSVERAELPKALKEHGLPNPIPVAVIGRLARDLTYEGSGLGLDMLQDALSKIVVASRTIGIRCVLVHAIDDNAARFWKKNEFIESPLGSRTFYLPIETIVDSLGD
ncbi:GNAT family N-acetyltransferase [Pseudorhodoplanes sp.]|uniref:GNAT family N-acetyltransferase n=1 Tax=Pseudorhodoplanes sp. TaxID=1934341 RepID=UPI003D1174FA